METVKTDVAIIGAGGAGLRAAIALAETDPKLTHRADLEGLPDAQPPCAAEGGAAGVIKPDDSMDAPLRRHRRRRRLAVRSGRGRVLHPRGAQGTDPARALGLSLEPRAGWLGGGAPVRRHEDQAHLVRRRQVGFPHPAHAVPDLAPVSFIQRFDEYLATDLLVDEGRCQGLTAIEMRSGQMRRFQAEGGDHRRRRRGPHVPVHHQRRDQDRRRHGARLPRGRAAQGHGVRAVPSHRAAEHGHPAHRRVSRRGRHPGQQERLPLPAGLRHGAGDTGRQAGAEDHGTRSARPPEPGVLARAAEGQYRRRRRGATACCSTCATWARRRSTSGCRSCAIFRISYLGVDPVKEPVPIRPVVHYMMGGIHTDINAATPLPGLFAAGECACVSINGANRLGSNSLMELLVFGHERRCARSRMCRACVPARTPHWPVKPRPPRRASARCSCAARAGVDRRTAQGNDRHDGGGRRHLPHRAKDWPRPATRSRNCAGATPT